MPNNYNGDPTAAAFASPVPIIQDGEVWQYGDGGSGVFGMQKPILDRVAWLHTHGGWVDQSNAWTGGNAFAGASTFNGAATFNGLTLLNHDGQIVGGSTLTVDSGAGLTVASGGTLTLASGSIIVDSGNRTILGIYTADGSSSNGIIRAINGGEIHAETGSFLGVHPGGAFNLAAGATANMLGATIFDGSGSPTGSVALVNDMPFTTDATSVMNLAGPFSRSGANAYMSERRPTRIAPTSATIATPHHADYVSFSGGITGDITLTVSDPPAGVYPRWTLFIHGGTAGHHVILKGSAGATIKDIDGTLGANTDICVTMVYDDGPSITPKWDIVACGVLP